MYGWLLQNSFDQYQYLGEDTVKGNRMVRYVFRLWLLLYRIENSLWEQYHRSFMQLNGGKDFPEYHQSQESNDDIPF
jgi:hypothetical protein